MITKSGKNIQTNPNIPPLFAYFQSRVLNLLPKKKPTKFGRKPQPIAFEYFMLERERELSANPPYAER